MGGKKVDEIVLTANDSGREGRLQTKKRGCGNALFFEWAGFFYRFCTIVGASLDDYPVTMLRYLRLDAKTTQTYEHYFTCLHRFATRRSSKPGVFKTSEDGACPGRLYVPGCQRIRQHLHRHQHPRRQQRRLAALRREPSQRQRWARCHRVRYIWHRAVQHRHQLHPDPHRANRH